MVTYCYYSRLFTRAPFRAEHDTEMFEIASPLPCTVVKPFLQAGMVIPVCITMSYVFSYVWFHLNSFITGWKMTRTVFTDQNVIPVCIEAPRFSCFPRDCPTPHSSISAVFQDGGRRPVKVFTTAPGVANVFSRWMATVWGWPSWF